MAKGKKLNYLEVKDYIEKNSLCKLISETYIQYDAPLEIKCGCGETFVTSFSKFKRKDRPQTECKKCSKELRRLKMMKPYREIKKEIEDNNCILLTDESNYAGTNELVNVRCGCGTEFQCSPNTMRCYNKYKCNKCSGKNRVSIEEVIEIISKVAEGYELISKTYNGVMNKMKFKCPVGHFFYKNWSHFYNDGERCPICVSSKGEARIANYLIENNLEYRHQYTFDDCKRKKVLPFDFAILKNGDVKFLIEYDGEQHFRAVDFGSMNKKKAEEKFRTQKEIDHIKNTYCDSENLKLIRIPYWEFENIESILDQELLGVV